MNAPDRMTLQHAEFDAASDFAKHVGRHDRTPVVDDDYPQVRHEYESSLAALLAAMKANGRFDQQGNRYALTTPPPASQERGGEVAPWPDFAGNPIHAGDRIKHADGVSGTVVYLPMLGPGGEAWRVVYDGEAILSRLCLQIGDKGQAVVLSPTCGTCGETIKPDPLTGTKCACAASPPSSAAESSINSPEIDSKLIPGAAEQAKPDDCPFCGQPQHYTDEDCPILSRAHTTAVAEQAQAGELPEAVAVVGPSWLIAWTGDGPIAPLVRAHGLKIGDGLYTADQMRDYANAAVRSRLAGGVTDEMAERAAFTWRYYTGSTENNARMRAALFAALSGGKNG